MRSSLRLKNFYPWLNRIARITALGGTLLMPVSVIGQEMTQECGELLQGRRFSLVVPYGPGGGYDAYAGVFATSFSALTDSTMRIRYLPGAGSIRGINAVVEAGPANQVLGMFNPNILLNEKIVGRGATDIDSLVFLGSLYSDTTVLVTREDYLVDFESSQSRIFALSSNFESRIFLPGFALGWNIELIRGYNGTTESILGLLRQDVDFIYAPTITIVNQKKSVSGLNAFLSVTDSKNPYFPDSHYLMGEGGILERITAGMPDEERLERQQIAGLAVELGNLHRAVSISRNTEPGNLSCLLAAVQRTLFSEELANLAADQNLIIEPVSGSEMQNRFNQANVLIEENWELLQELSAPFRQ